MQSLAEDYQHALADIASLRSIYDNEIEGLQKELQAAKENQETVARRVMRRFALANSTVSSQHYLYIYVNMIKMYDTKA